MTLPDLRDDARKEIDAAIAEARQQGRTSANATIADLVKALEPLAALGCPEAGSLSAYHDLPADTVVYRSGNAAITAGDVRAAASALARSKAQGGDLTKEASNG